MSKLNTDIGSDLIPLFDTLSLRLSGRTILREQSLSVERGKITVLMGPSGVGKSVLADAVFRMGVSSSLLVEGELGAAREVGALVFQEGGGLPHLTVQENLGFVVRSKSSGEEAAQEGGGVDAEELVDQFELSPDTLGNNLSGGERRRLAVARSLLANRIFIWLDEPEAGLDLQRVDDLAEMLKQAARDRDLALLVTTHNPQFASAIGDRVIFLGHDGTLTEFDEGRSGPESEQTEFGSSSRLSLLKGWLSDKLQATRPPQTTDVLPKSSRGRRATMVKPVEWLMRIGQSVPFLFVYPFMRQARRTFSLSLSLAALRGAVFYPFIGAILGGVFVLIFQLSVPLLIDSVGLVHEFGANIVLRISPPIAAILVAACAGSTLASWLGQMAASRQLDALDVLGVHVKRWVIGPIWWGLCIATVTNTVLFALAFAAVFAGYIALIGTHELHTVSTFWSSFVQPGSLAPAADLSVALAKSAGYGAIVAAVTTARCTASDMRSSEDVASAVTGGIVWSTIIVMAAELATLVANFFVGAAA